MSDTVCIPKEEYDFRLKCKHVVTSEFSEKFSDAFIQSVRESEESYKRGEFVRVKNTKERRILFDSLWKWPYQEVLTRPFLNDVKDIKKDKNLLDRLNKKMDEIITNPEHYTPKRHNLKGKRAAHVGSYVIVYELQGQDLVYLRFKHHDFTYY